MAEVRTLSYSDLPEVVEIERRSFPAPWSLAMFVLELSKPSSVCLTLVEADSIVGYLICSRYDTDWHVMNVAVDPDKRRAGMASKLLDSLFERVGAAKKRYTLEVRKSNSAAIALYKKYGFREAGYRRRYYQDNGEDAVIMWLTPGTRQGTLEDVPMAEVGNS